MAAPGLVERNWSFRPGRVSRSHLLWVTLRAVLFGFGGVSFLGLSLLTCLASVLAGSMITPGIESALLTIGILNVVVVLAILSEEALHAVTVVQCAGESALRGIATRRGSWFGVPIPLSIGVVYAPSLELRERCEIAAGGVLGSMFVVGLLAVVLWGMTGDAAAFWLVMVPGVNLLPLRRLGATAVDSDGDAIVEALTRLRPGITQGLALVLRPCWRALFVSLGATTPARARSIEAPGTEPAREENWSENHG